MAPQQRRRWMVFVDGENLTARAEALYGGILNDERWYICGVFVWLPQFDPRMLWRVQGWGTEEWAVRAHYYTSVRGDTPRIDSIRKHLRNLGFQPQVFKRDADQAKAKGVDIALTKDMLSHAFLNNYDVAVLFAGDGDYLPLVQEVQRLGKLVFLVFFDGAGSGLNEDLQVQCDQFIELNGHFQTQWTRSDR